MILLINRKSWTEQDRFDWLQIRKSLQKIKALQYYYNEEFDPGSGWTLATGLTHASRGAAYL